MKLFELGRLGPALSLKLLVAYAGAKGLKRKLVEGQNELIIYFNYLIRLDLRHVEEQGKYYKVHSKQYGFFLLRKPPSSDYKAFEQIFVDKEYQQLVTLVSQNESGKSISILDGGANIGLVSVFLFQALKQQYDVHPVLVEPFEDNLVSAKLNCALQNITSANFELAGLYNRAGYLKIETEFRDGLEWSVQVKETDQPGKLPAVEITGLLDKYQIGQLNILKLDIEGTEKYLFQDKHYAANFLRRTDIIAIEIHHEYIDENTVLDILRENGFSLQKHGELHIGIRKNI